MAPDTEGTAPSRLGQVGSASVIGGLAGAALIGHRGAKPAMLGAVAGAVGLGVSEAVARARQRPGEIPALWQRIATTSALMAPLGWAAGRFTGVGPVVVGTSAGAVVGAFGLRPQKVALGPLVGATVGLAASTRRRRVPAAAVASATVLAYRLLSAQLFRDVTVFTTSGPVMNMFEMPFTMKMKSVIAGE